jgi:MTH538 TIR-like domain (DUF1863)
VAHRTFFSFYYADDIWRATNVRNCGALLKSDVEFIDASLWEKAEGEGDAAVKRLVDAALDRASVTAVLIGANTASRRWVQYEIAETVRRGMGLFGVHIYRIADQNSNESTKGLNPLPDGYPVYLWNSDKGSENMGGLGRQGFRCGPSGLAVEGIRRCRTVCLLRDCSWGGSYG